MLLENILCLSAFLLSVAFIVYIEKTLWQTYITPVILSAVPMAVILTLSVILSFYGILNEIYPSTILFLLWGVLLFEIPSLLCSGLYKVKRKYYAVKPIRSYRLLFWMTIVLILVYSLFINKSISSISVNIGTDDFAEETASGGLYAHLRNILISFLVIWICIYEKRNRLYSTIFIAAIIIFAFINQVKGWIVMPVLSGIILRVILNKTKLNLPLICLIIILGISIFYFSYYFALVIGNNNNMSDEINEFILNHIIHYLTSGIMGLNHYLHSNISEPIEIKNLFAPFINLFQSLIGGQIYQPKDLMSRNFISTGVGMSNIRTFYGTAYILIGPWLYPAYVMLVSFMMYILNIVTLKKSNLFITAIYAWFCAIMFMSWFDSYFQLFTTFEIPCLLFMFYMIDRIK